MEECSQA